MIETTQCPHCDCRMSKVVETRQIQPHGLLLKIRIRRCRNCQRLFRTKEIVDQEIKYPNIKRTGNPTPPKSNLDVGAIF